MPIKVLFIINDLGLGGVQRLTVEFANFMDKEKFDVSVATLFSRPESFFYKDQLTKNVRLFEFSFRGFSYFHSWLKFYHFLKKGKYSIVFTQLFVADFIGRITSFIAGVPFIITEIQNIIPTLPKKYIYTDRLLQYITTACISTTQAVTDYAIEVIKFPKHKIIEIPTNAVDARRFNIVLDKVAVKK